MASEAFSFTTEQKRIIKLCPRPHEGRKKGIVFRVTAAAGSGKTTSLLGLAKEAVQRNHQSLTYCTFTKAAANDGRQRMLRCGVDLSRVHLEARTIHSLAALVLNQDEEEMSNNGNRLYDEKRFKKWLSKTLKKEIDGFLTSCENFWKDRARNPRELKERLRRARDQVEFFIYKNFVVNFCQTSWSLETFKDRHNFKRVYYPVKKFFDDRTKAHLYGLHEYRNDDFFPDMTVLAWEKAMEENIATHDIQMKRAQLGKYEIPGSIILVDESQDMDACQVAFCVQNQVEYGKVVYVVGDPAQTIFGFRGAKAKNLMNMKVNRSLPLTQSWRFGPAIAKVANVVLYAKENSPQTKKDSAGRDLYWEPYRISAGRPLGGVVTEERIVKSWNTYEDPVTIIARTNARLMMEALDVLGFEFPDQEEESDEEGNGCYRSDDESLQFALGNHRPVPMGNGVDVPKIHLYGKGEGSGAKGWKKVIKMVAEVYHLYEIRKEQGASVQLSSNFHPEFYDRKVTWNEYIQDCQDKELTKYTRVNHIVFKYTKNTMKAVEAFREHVMNKNVPESEADIIFTTCHSAKGMEWPHVQVCEDFLDLCTFEDVPLEDSNKHNRNQDENFGSKWRFKFKEFDNDVNLLYVACTRAKKTLSLPQTFCKLLWGLDRITEFINGSDPSDEQEGEAGHYISLGSKAFDFAEAQRFHRDLVAPLRKEMNLASHEKLADNILTAPVTSPPSLLQEESNAMGLAEPTRRLFDWEQSPADVPQVSQESDTMRSTEAYSQIMNDGLWEGAHVMDRSSLPFVSPDDERQQRQQLARERSLPTVLGKRLDFGTGLRRRDDNGSYRKKRK